MTLGDVDTFGILDSSSLVSVPFEASLHKCSDLEVVRSLT